MEPDEAMGHPTQSGSDNKGPSIWAGRFEGSWEGPPNAEVDTERGRKKLSLSRDLTAGETIQHCQKNKHCLSSLHLSSPQRVASRSNHLRFSCEPPCPPGARAARRVLRVIPPTATAGNCLLGTAFHPEHLHHSSDWCPLALGYVAARSIEAALFAIGTMHLLTLVFVSHRRSLKGLSTG